VKASFVEDIPYFQRGSPKCIEAGSYSVVLLVKSFQRHNVTATYLKSATPVGSPDAAEGS
jgi:hypothetical protein